MEKGSRGVSCRAAICGIVVLLSATAFSCSLAAEFRKVKEKDMKLDGSLCSLPRSSAFGLGVAAIAFLSVAQVVGTTAAATTMCAGSKPSKSAASRGHAAPVSLLVLSWVSFALAVVLLATAASMNHGQRYGRGWMDGDCYVARNGVFAGAAALVVLTALLILAFTSAAKPAAAPPSTTAAACTTTTTTIRVDAAATTAGAEQPGSGRSKQ